jgi:hypothetical protein
MSLVPQGKEDIFLVFVTAKPGREAPYQQWFANTHMSDMRGLSSVRSAQAYTMEPGGTAEAPAQLCAIYEFEDGPLVLGAIAEKKGTPELPHSDDQGVMVWRLFATPDEASGNPIPSGQDALLALLEIPRPDVDTAALQRLAQSIAEQSGLSVRALHLSSIQPKRGSEFGAALVISGKSAAQAADIVSKTIDSINPGTAYTLYPLKAA